jgi:hypothetical protein
MKELDRNLLEKTEKLVREERRITAEILDCLSEIESKMIYAALAYSSLYEFCVKHSEVLGRICSSAYFGNETTQRLAGKYSARNEK